MIENRDAVAAGRPRRATRAGAIAALAAMLMGSVSPALAANLLENTATATGTPAGGTLTDPTSDETVDVVDKSATVRLYKTAVLADTDSSGSDTVGDTITYTFTVTNTGNVTLSNLALQDADVTGITYNPADDVDTDNDIDTLAPGATKTITATYQITQTDLDQGYHQNTASIVGTDPQSIAVSDTSDAGDDAVETADGTGSTDGNTTNDPTVTPLTTTASMTVAKTDTLNMGGDGMATAGDTISYSIVVTNTGTATLYNVAVTDPGVTGITYGPEDGDTDNDIDSLAPGASATVTASHTLTQTEVNSGSYSNQATAAGATQTSTPVSQVSDDPDTGTADDATVTPLPAAPAMTIAKVGVITTDGGTSGEADKDDVITYTYTVTNTGNVTIANVTVGDVHNGYGTAPVPGGEAPNSVVNGSSDAAVNGSWDTLQPGDSITFTATYTVVQDDVDNLQ